MGNNDDIFMARYSAFNPYRIRHNDMGYQKPIGYGDAMAKSLYCGMKPTATWMSDNVKCITGGVYNLEFSPEGSILVAACEKRAIQIFDPLTHKSVHSVVEAHLDCVNCVKFLDGRMFATCSDDTTIALWDIRNLKKKICSLYGHSKWVKNIEFSVRDKLLVTSGLDGSIYTWDINSYTESNLVFHRVFHTASLMRCRLSQDARQMVMCTTGGLIIVIHNLNLETLAHDLHGFKPNMYRLMQMSNQLIPIAAMYDHLFDSNRKENRVEFVSDFPEGNDAEVISALQIHPQGWCALSRNTSHDDRSEWTCLHDIQPLDETQSKSVRDAESPRTSARRGLAPVRTPSPRRRRLRVRLQPFRAPRPRQHVAPVRRVPQAGGGGGGGGQRLAVVELGARAAHRGGGSVAPAAASTAGCGGGRSRRGRGGGRCRRGGAGGGGAAGPSQPRSVIIANAAADAAASRLGRGIQNDVWEASINIKQYRLLREIYSRGQVRPNFNMQRITGVNTGIAPPPRPAVPAEHFAERPSTSGHSPRAAISEDARLLCRHYIRQNRERLLYYTEETNEGKGFIKELCFSSDGRVVCSPFGRGMRLLALDENCSELNQCVASHRLPRPMLEVGQSLGHHQDLVVSSRFSPRYHLLVTGCLEGRVVWYQPHSGEM